MKRSKSIVWTTLAIATSLGVLYFARINTNAGREERMQMHRLRITLERGFMLTGIIEDYHERNGSYPALDTLKRSISVIWRVPVSELLTDYENGSARIVETFDNRGGWVYDRSKGALYVNSRKPFVISPLDSVFVVPFEISFGVPPKLPITCPSRGVEFSETLHQILIRAEEFRGIAKESGLLNRENETHNGPQ